MTKIILQPDGEGDQTQNIQEALDTVWLFGGGIVELSAGTYNVSSVRIRSYTTLLMRSGTRLIASRDPDAYACIENDTLEALAEEDRTEKKWEPFVLGKKRDYSFFRAGGRWNHAVIRAVDAEQIAIIGEEDSVIDGCNCYDADGEEGYRGPHGIGLYRCKNAVLSGYTIQNTGNWAHTVFYSDNILCEKLTVLAGHDGVHFFGCNNITVRDCSFYTGDDCVAGFANTNTLVENCICNTACSGLRFGGTNVLVRNCSFLSPSKYCFRWGLSLEEKKSGAVALGGGRNMLSVFTYYADLSIPITEQPGNIIIKDCTVENADRLIHYNFSGNERWQSAKPLESLSLENIKASGIRMPLTAYGSAETPLKLSIKSVKLDFDTEMWEKAFMHTANCEQLVLEDVRLTGIGDTPKILTWTPIDNLRLTKMQPCVCEDEIVVMSHEPFTCKPI